MHFVLQIWRQKSSRVKGAFSRHEVEGITADMSVLEMLEARISHLGLVPQGQPERARRAIAMVARMDDEGLGNCSWHGECRAAGPKSIIIDSIARTRHDWFRTSINARSVNGVDHG